MYYFMQHIELSYIVNWSYLSYIIGWRRDNTTTEDGENGLFKITIGKNGHYKIKSGIFYSTIQGPGYYFVVLLL